MEGIKSITASNPRELQSLINKAIEDWRFKYDIKIESIVYEQAFKYVAFIGFYPKYFS